MVIRVLGGSGNHGDVMDVGGMGAGKEMLFVKSICHTIYISQLLGQVPCLLLLGQGTL